MDDRKARILIVDDQPSARELLKGLLLPEGYELTLATSGLETLACLEELNPDTILLDVMMPGMDGFEVCRRLKADERWRHIPVILITALDSQEDLARGLDAGADDFLHKPVNGLELRARVRSMLRIRKQFKELQTTLQLREDLAAMMVHDMRNSITTILGLSELLLIVNDLLPKYLKDIKMIRREADRLNTFLNDMLMLAKMEQDELILHRSRVEMNQLVLAIEESHQPIAQSRKIKLVTDLPAESQQFSLDANLFRRVLDNLISNALKFSLAQDTVTIKVEYPEQTATSGQLPRLRLSVLDEGPGIPEAHRDSIFDKFKIVDLKKQDIPQVGLGLAFCKLVVEAHGGRIFVESNEPQGSIFTVEI